MPIIKNETSINKNKYTKIIQMNNSITNNYPNFNNSYNIHQQNHQQKPSFSSSMKEQNNKIQNLQEEIYYNNENNFKKNSSIKSK